MAERQGTGRFASDDRLQGTLLTAAVLSLPALLPGVLGWLPSLIPLPAFYYAARHGLKRGSLIIGAGFLLATGIEIGVGAAPAMLLSLLFLPTGFALAHAVRRRESPLRAGVQASLAMLMLLAAFWLTYGAVSGTNPYGALAAGLDEGVTAARDYYRESADLPKEKRQEIEAAFEAVRALIPRVLPALIAVTVLFTVWLNMLAGSRLLQRAGEAPWPPYREWRLPDWLVWGVIAGGFALLLPGALLSTAGLNLLFVFGLLYFFQGLAVLAGLLMRWAVPRPLRLAAYIFLFIQIYGVLLIAALGLLEVWADLRKSKTNAEQ